MSSFADKRREVTALVKGAGEIRSWPRCSRPALTIAAAVSASVMVEANAETPTIQLVEMADGRGHISGSPPAAGSFIVEFHPFAGQSFVAGFLTVVPKAENPTCELVDGLEGAVQVHRVALVPAGSESGVARATVPHLQVGREFCFMAQYWSAHLVANEQIDSIIGLMSTSEVLQTNLSPQGAKRLAFEALRDLAEHLESHGAGGRVREYLYEQIDPLGDRIWEDFLASSDSLAVQNSVALVEREITEQRERIATLLAAAIRERNSLQASLARASITPEAVRGDVELGPLVEALDATIASTAPERIPSELFEAHEAARQALQLETQVEEQLERARADTAVRMSAALRTTIGATVRVPRVVSSTARAETNDFGNIIWPTVGAGVAVVLLDNAEGAQFVTYGGLAGSICLQAVERSLPMAQLVNQPCQRLSWLLGTTITGLSDVDAVEVSGFLGDAHLTFGFGYRFVRFAELHLLFVISEASRASASSDAATLLVSPALGLSADLDVIDLLGKALSGLP